MITATASRSGCVLTCAGLRDATSGFDSAMGRLTVMVFVSVFPLVSVAAIVNTVSCPARATFFTEYFPSALPPYSSPFILSEAVSALVRIAIL